MLLTIPRVFVGEVNQGAAGEEEIPGCPAMEE